MRISVERGQQLIEEVGRHDRHDVTLEEDLVGTPFRGNAHEVARGLMHQSRCILDPPLGLGPDSELESV